MVSNQLTIRNHRQMTIWYSGDWHFSHTNILVYCKRPWKYVWEMNEALIANWNSVVKETDQAYILGDCGMGSPAHLAGILKRLNGKKYLIRGNHDKSIKNESLGYFEWDKEYAKVYPASDGQAVILCHYPILSWDGMRRGSWMLHAHSHRGCNHLNVGIKRFDVGVDNCNYFPISHEQLKEIMDARGIIAPENKEDQRQGHHD